jgi:hypothetical protein
MKSLPKKPETEPLPSTMESLLFWDVNVTELFGQNFYTFLFSSFFSYVELKAGTHNL